MNKYLISMPKDFHDKAVLKAKEENMSLSMYIRFAINELRKKGKNDD